MTEKPFKIIGVKRPEVDEKVDNLVKTLLGKKEYERYRKLPLTKKKVYIEKFKKSEIYRNYQDRLDYVNEHYKSGQKAGWMTDRGRIYIKYGPPDELVSRSFTEKIKPIQHWVYYGNGLHLIFMDIYGDGDYRLLWSNNPDEPGMPDWDRYLPEWLIEEY
ncbi:MAG TPA: GWxTD domain-containing protein [bacterium (Candidatus Stahlbacteria)]|nr:GWxTD domain-containing protein [Candidatus Stahlbacteria bacterium]